LILDKVGGLVYLFTICGLFKEILTLGGRFFLEFFELGVAFDLVKLMLNSIELQKHSLDFYIVVFSQINNFIFKLIYLPIFPFLALDKDNRVIKILLLQVIFVIFPQDLNLAAKVVIGALDQLKLADLSVPFEILSLDFASTFVVTFNDFAKAPVVMRLKVLVNNDGGATHVLTLDAPEIAGYLMGLHLSTLQLDRATLLK
jgi:hypothetical protein